MDYKPKFLQALDRIKTALQLSDNPSDEYINLLWQDLQKYGAISWVAVINAMEDYRTHARYKQYPKVGDLIPLIEKRLFPDADKAYEEACRYIGEKAHKWSHEVVRASAVGMGAQRLKTGEKGVREAFSARYQDTIDQYLKGKRFELRTELPAPPPANDMTDIATWMANHGAGKEDYYLLYYITKKGDIARRLKAQAVKTMRTLPWWQAFVDKHGKEPVLP